MAYKHPLQQTAVFATLVNFFEAPLELNPEIMVMSLDRPIAGEKDRQKDPAP